MLPFFPVDEILTVDLKPSVTKKVYAQLTQVGVGYTSKIYFPNAGRGTFFISSLFNFIYGLI